MKWYLLLFLVFTWQCDGEEDGAITELEGTWATTCENDSNGTSSEQTTITFAGGLVSGTSRFYSGENCTTEVLNIASSGTFTVGDDVAGVDGAKNLDIETESLIFEVKSEAIVTQYNSDSYCGKSDWAVNTPASLNPGDCGFPTGAHLDIFKVSGDSLQLGDSEDIEDSTQTRPTALEDTTYTKQ